MQHKVRTIRVPDQEWNLFLYLTRQNRSNASAVLLAYLREYNRTHAEKPPVSRDWGR